MDELFDPIVISGEVGLRKPDRAIYELALAQLDVPAQEAVFIDDAEPNLLGARAVGITTVLHRDASSTRRRLAQLIPSLSPDLETSNR
jgi:putative hydrolase of the HAD superfamily